MELFSYMYIVNVPNIGIWNGFETDIIVLGSQNPIEEKHMLLFSHIVFKIICLLSLHISDVEHVALC